MSPLVPDAGGSLLDACPCLLDFISVVVRNTSSDPSVLSFALKLAGLLAASEDGFQRLQVRLIKLFICSQVIELTCDISPCRNVHFWTRSLAFSAGRKQGSGRILVSGLVGSTA